MDGQTPEPNPFSLDLDAMMKLVEQTQKVQHAIHPQPAKVPLWASGETAQTAAWATLVPSLVTGCANLAVHQWGFTGPGITGSVASAALLALTVMGANNHWDMRALATTVGMGAGAVSFTMAAGGTGWMDVAAWLVGAASTVAYKIVWNRKHAADKANVNLIQAKTRTETLKGDAVLSKSALADALALVKLQQAQAEAVAPVGPVLHGATPEESALRRAVWDVFQEQLYSCDVGYTRTGWAATVGLPVALSRDTARNGWDKVNSALRADGRFVVSNGRLSNELSVKFVDRTKVDTSPLPWSMNVIPPALDAEGRPQHLMSVGVDTETGEHVLMQFDERLLICGASGTGKSWTARPLLAHAHLAGQLIFIDAKNDEANIWRNICQCASDPDEIVSAIQYAHQVMNQRKAEMAEREITVWDGDQLTVAIDEGQVVLFTVAQDKDTLQMLRELSSLGRSRGVVLWWATQKPVISGSAPGLDTLIAGNMLNRFSLRVATEQESRTALDDCAYYEPHKIPEDRNMRGHGYLKGYGPSLIRAWTMDDDAVRALPAKLTGVPGGGSVSSTGTSRLDLVTRYLSENPRASKRAVAAELGIPEGSVGRLIQAARKDL
jgi:hypothetical protein